MPEALAEDRQNVMYVWAGRLELKGREIVDQLDRGWVIFSQSVILHAVLC